MLLYLQLLYLQLLYLQLLYLQSTLRADGAKASGRRLPQNRTTRGLPPYCAPPCKAETETPAVLWTRCHHLTSQLLLFSVRTSSHWLELNLCELAA
jgi:hypothetical protein